MKPRKLEHHGHTAGKKQPAEYQIWAQIKQRCFNKNHPKYKNYGGRGIDMDPRWIASFATFLEEVGSRPQKGLQIDRIDNSKGYWPGNVRWTTPVQQSRNKRTNRLVQLKGAAAKPLIQVAEENKIGKRRLRERLESGLSPDEAVSRPIEGGTRYVTWNGESHNLAMWARKFKVPYQTLHHWIHRDKKPIKVIFTKLSRGEWPTKGKSHSSKSRED